MYDSRIQSGFRGSDTILRTSNDLEYYVDWGKVNRAVEGFLTECVFTAQVIYAAATKPIGILMTGGLDSECVLRAFRQANIPHTCFALRYEDGLNKFDVDGAEKICKLLGSPLEIIDFDLQGFFDKELWDTAWSWNIHSPHVCMDVKMFSMFPNHHIILCAGDFVLERKSLSTRNIFSVEAEEYMAPERFLRTIPIFEGTPRFFKHNPEIMLSFLTDPLVQRWVKLAFAMRSISITDWKPYMFDVWYDGNVKPRVKAHGYERIVPRYERTEEKLSLKLPYKNAIFNQQYEELIQVLR